MSSPTARPLPHLLLQFRHIQGVDEIHGRNQANQNQRHRRQLGVGQLTEAVPVARGIWVMSLLLAVKVREELLLERSSISHDHGVTSEGEHCHEHVVTQSNQQLPLGGTQLEAAVGSLLKDPVPL